jgi:hypothetical protein
MNESRFSINFKMFNRDGLQAQFTVRADEINDHREVVEAYIEQLYLSGWSVTEPEKGLHTTDQVIGYMWTQFNNKRENRLDICCALYTERGLFKSYSVYPEGFAKLPPSVMETKPTTTKGVPKVAPDKENAMNDDDFRTWRATIRITPKLGHDGEPVKNDKGYITYLYDGVVGAEPAKTTAKDIAPQTPHEGQGVSSKSSVEPSPELASLRKLMNALGTTLYESKWETYRHKVAAEYGAKRIPPVEITSSNDLAIEELRLFTFRLEKAARTKINAIAKEYDLEIPYSDYVPGAVIVEDLSGWPLYKLLKELTDMSNNDVEIEAFGETQARWGGSKS